MLSPNFKKYSLALIKDNNIVFSSDKSGLRPLIECIKEYKSKFKDCILHDKVVGLAAARLIVYSNMISLVISDVASKPTGELLNKNNVIIKAQKIVDNILTKDKSAICPMELKAQRIDNNKDFFSEINNIFYPS
ncbi:MAG: DUF1893 domain-containing protein [Nanoarchaeota archaeon]|nr:DUF1893 domain-containing protein [Nanoarchaeota archaeon]